MTLAALETHWESIHCVSETEILLVVLCFSLPYLLNLGRTRLERAQKQPSLPSLHIASLA